MALAVESPRQAASVSRSAANANRKSRLLKCPSSVAHHRGMTARASSAILLIAPCTVLMRVEEREVTDHHRRSCARTNVRTCRGEGGYARPDLPR